MSCRQLNVVCWMLLCATSGTAQYRERIRTYDVLHYSIAISVDEQLRRVTGTVQMKIVPLRQLAVIEIDAAEMKIERVRSGSTHASLPFTHAGERLRVTPPSVMTAADTVSLDIRYSCSPRNGLYFFQPDSAYPNRPWQIWSQGENEDNHFWFPCYDYPNDKATIDLRVTVNKTFSAISNGALIEVTDHPGTQTKTFHWFNAKPIASYLISLVIGDYVKIEERYKTIPVEYYVYPHQTGDAMRSFSQTVAMMTFFSSKIGFDYPWQKYAQTVVTEFMYGGMENASAATLTDKTIHNERAHLDVASDNLVAHELAHQWFGDLLTCRNWAHSWLNEGFATFFQALYVEHSKGADEYQFDMLEKQRSIVESDTGVNRRPTITDSYIDPFDVFDNRIYARGAAILHMLRGVLGEQRFWAGIKRYVDLHQYDVVVTSDFQQAMEEEAGQSLHEFFDQWTRHAGFPAFVVSQRYDTDAKCLHLVVRQTQPIDSLTPLYSVPLLIDVATRAGTMEFPITIDAKPEQRISISVPERPLNVTFDKGNRILKTLRHEKPIDSWLYQLQHGNVTDRVAALNAVELRMHQAEVRTAVARTLATDKFWGVRKKAAEALGRWHDPAVFTLLAPAFTDRDARVRVAATESMQHVKSLDALVALGTIVQSDSSDAVISQAIQSLVAIDSANGWKYCEKGLALASHHDIIRAGAAKALGTLRTDESKKRLITLTFYGHSMELRQASVEALADNWKTDDVRYVLEELTTDRMERVQRKAIEKLGTIASPHSRGVLNDVIKMSPDAILRREARLALLKIERAIRS